MIAAMRGAGPAGRARIRVAVSLMHRERLHAPRRCCPHGEKVAVLCEARGHRETHTKRMNESEIR